MRNWEQVLTVPPATSDWTVTQISLNKKNEKKSSNYKRKNKKRRIFVKSQEEKIETKLPIYQQHQNTKSAFNTTATIFIKADFLNAAEYFVDLTLLKKYCLRKKIKATYCQILTRFCR
jgi:hypothetical protein